MKETKVRTALWCRIISRRFIEQNWNVYLMLDKEIANYRYGVSHAAVSIRHRARIWLWLAITANQSNLIVLIQRMIKCTGAARLIYYGADVQAKSETTTSWQCICKQWNACPLPIAYCYANLELFYLLLTQYSTVHCVYYTGITTIKQ